MLGEYKTYQYLCVDVLFILWANKISPVFLYLFPNQHFCYLSESKTKGDLAVIRKGLNYYQAFIALEIPKT